MKRICFIIAAILSISMPCASRSVVEKEESVVSVYTTNPTTYGTSAPLDVYHQIANNIAERITSPIYRFLGINQNKTDAKPTKKSWDTIENLDELEDVSKPDLPPIDNGLSLPREVEELSPGAGRKSKKPEKISVLTSWEAKPERITLFSSYLPVKSEESNDTRIDEGFFNFETDDAAEETPREGPLIFLLELMSSIIQLLWGGFWNLFNPKPDNSDSS